VKAQIYLAWLRISLVIIAFFSGLSVASCAKDYVTGRPTFTLVDEATEIRIGAAEDKKVVAVLGVYEDEKLSDFVAGLGQHIAQVCHRPNLTYTFRVVDSPVINAFALPGGYIYITRGLMAHVNSIDELVGVMAHEVGHVAARHSAKQISRQAAASGFGLFNIVNIVVPPVGGLLSAPSQLMLLSYSRKQESQSDDLSVAYTTRLNYDSRELARFLTLLQRLAASDDRKPPIFLSTHPDSGDRARAVVKLSKKWQSKLNWDQKDPDVSGYLALIDGIVYGDNPRRGYTERGTFYHPDLGFEFPYPKNWKLINSHAAVILISPKRDAVMYLTTQESTSPIKVAERTAAESDLVVISSEKVRVSGLKVYKVHSTTSDQRTRILSYYILLNKRVYVFHAFTSPKRFEKRKSSFTIALHGFKQTSDPAVLGKKPLRVRIKTAGKNTTLGALLKTYRVPARLHKNIVELNVKALTDPITAGETVKIISE
jgi:predicted Zn-dependent protease